MNDKVGSKTVLSYLYVCPTNKRKVRCLKFVFLFLHELIISQERTACVSVQRGLDKRPASFKAAFFIFMFDKFSMFTCTAVISSAQHQSVLSHSGHHREVFINHNNHVYFARFWIGVKSPNTDISY